jgi:transposase-like protein
LNNVITIDDERIKSHLDWVVRGSVEETLNALLEAEADRLCNAQRYERRGHARGPTMSASCRPRPARYG